MTSSVVSDARRNLSACVYGSGDGASLADNLTAPMEATATVLYDRHSLGPVATPTA